MFMSLKIFFYILLIKINNLYGWKLDGHFISAHIAQKMLNKAEANAAYMITQTRSLSAISDWADGFCLSHKWCRSFDFFSTHPWVCDIDYEKFCQDDKCIGGSFKNYTRNFKASSSLKEKDEALKFIIGLAGDAHQPLRMGFNTDWGGTFIKVNLTFLTNEYYFNSNLFETWEDRLITQYLTENYDASWLDMAEDIHKEIMFGKYQTSAQKWAEECACDIDNCIDTALKESAKLACTRAYVTTNNKTIQNNDNLYRDYYISRMKVIEERLAAAGVRLGVMLNSLLGDENSCKTKLIIE